MLRRIPVHSVLAAAFVLLSCAACRGESSTGGPAAASGGPAPRVVIIGLDAADWMIIDRLAAEGRLPNLSRLRREGAWGPLRSEIPLLSPIVWTTIATGRQPLDHGIFGFLTRRNGAEEPVRSDERQVRAFWNIASEQNVPVGVMGWYATWPAEPVKGFIVSDRAGVHQVTGGSQRPTGGLAWPADVERDVESTRRDIARDLDKREAVRYFAPDADLSLLSKEQMSTFVGTLRTTEMHRRLFWPLCRKYRPALAAVYFEGTDSVGHLFVENDAPGAARVDPRFTPMFGGALDKFYDHIDVVIGELTAPLSPRDTTVIIVSDHGFKTGEIRPRAATFTELGNQAPQWHRMDGVVLLWGRGVKPGVRLEKASIYDVTPTALRLLGLPLARNLTGHPLEQALTPEVLAAPAQFVADFEAKGPRKKAAPTTAASAEENEEQIERLRALGYVGGALPAEKPGASGPREGQMAVAINVFNRAQMLEEARRLPEALEVHRDLVQRWPDSVLGYYGEGLTLMRMGRYEEAAPFLQRAVTIGKDVALVHALMGDVEMRTGRTKEAEASFLRALQLDPAMAHPALLLAQIVGPRGETDRAQNLLEQAQRCSEIPGEKAAILVEMAKIAEVRRQFDRAEQLYRQALDEAPAFPMALGRCAQLLLHENRPADAAPLLEQLVHDQPDDFRALAMYGYALARTGRKQEAKDALQRSLKIEPRQEDARALLSQLGS